MESLIWYNTCLKILSKWTSSHIFGLYNLLHTKNILISTDPPWKFFPNSCFFCVSLKLAQWLQFHEFFQNCYFYKKMYFLRIPKCHVRSISVKKQRNGGYLDSLHFYETVLKWCLKTILIFLRQLRHHLHNLTVF